MAAILGNQDKLPAGIIWFFSAWMTARDPCERKDWVLQGVSVWGDIVPSKQMEIPACPRRSKVMRGLCLAHGFILGLLSDPGRKGCPWLLKIRKSSVPSSTNWSGATADSRKQKWWQCQELVLNYSQVYQDSSQAGSVGFKGTKRSQVLISNT